MNKSIFTYLRTSTLLRVFSTIALVALTASSIVAGSCGGCSLDAPVVEVTSNSGSCPMSQSNRAFDTERSSCCCSNSSQETKKVEVQKVKTSKSSCCSTGEAETAQLRISDADPISPILGLPATTNTKQASCDHFGSCASQLQNDTKSIPPPPPRSLEQERQNNTISTVQVYSTLADASFSVRDSKWTFSILPAEPSILSGIGSQMLRC